MKENEILRFELVVDVKYREDWYSDDSIMKKVAKLIMGSSRGGREYRFEILDVKKLK